MDFNDLFRLFVHLVYKSHFLSLYRFYCPDRSSLYLSMRYGPRYIIFSGQRYYR